MAAAFEKATSSGKTDFEAFAEAQIAASEHAGKCQDWATPEKVSRRLTYYFNSQLSDWRNPKEWGIRGCTVENRTYYAIADLEAVSDIKEVYIGETTDYKRRWQAQISSAKMQVKEALAPLWITALWDSGRKPYFFILENTDVLICPWKKGRTTAIGLNGWATRTSMEYVWAYVAERAGLSVISHDINIIPNTELDPEVRALINTRTLPQTPEIGAPRGKERKSSPNCSRNRLPSKGERIVRSAPVSTRKEIFRD